MLLDATRHFSNTRIDIAKWLKTNLTYSLFLTAEAAFTSREESRFKLWPLITRRPTLTIESGVAMVRGWKVLASTRGSE